MEILDYFKAIGRKFWVLVLLPLVAALVPTGWFLLRPTQYAAHATVIPTALVGAGINQYRGAEADKQFVANVTAAAKTRKLVDQVAAETKVPATRVRAGLDVKQVNLSAFVSFNYVTTHKAEAVPVVRAAAADTLHFLFQSQVDVAQAQVDAAQKQIADAESGLQQLSRDTGGTSPEDAYNALSKGLPALQAEAARSRDSAGAAQIQQQLNARQAELADLSKKQGEYVAFVDVRRRAVNLRDQSEQRVRVAQAQLAAADPAHALSITKVHRSFPFTDLLQAAVGASAGTLFLAVGYLLVSEVWAGVRGRGAQPATATG
jgi:hypothetical protein